MHFNSNIALDFIPSSSTPLTKMSINPKRPAPEFFDPSTTSRTSGLRFLVGSSNLIAV
ncbi:hypothetical protein C2G38_2124871 [Gigaspora rosea]|uniref:Uncharacterized protein n=2 Tax=Gigaspora rosea TaxID=44941 RepID=A0A397U5C6_9GLOM|nr:hypothetical protein C2G38_2124871 [Gigaspora rosea]